jgi:hypothetical protein
MTQGERMVEIEFRVCFFVLLQSIQPELYCSTKGEVLNYAWID